MNENTETEVIEEVIDGYDEITPEYVYLTIPADWVCLYHKLLVYLADFGLDALKDCSAECNGTNKRIIKCWNMFNAALAAKALNRTKEANVLIKYITAQLETIYDKEGKEQYTGRFSLPVDENGMLKAYITCKCNESKFYIKSSDGMLYEQFLEDVVSKQYEIDNNGDLNETLNGT